MKSQGSMRKRKISRRWDRVDMVKGRPGLLGRNKDVCV